VTADIFSLQLPTASPTHFLVKLFFAAPASFLPAASVSQIFCASPSHFYMKLVRAAPASFLSVACTLQVAPCAKADPATMQNAAANAIDFIETSRIFEPRRTKLALRAARRLARIELRQFLLLHDRAGQPSRSGSRPMR
jgi:hypothetical protein